MYYRVMVTTNEILSLSERYSAAWVAHDVEAIVALHTPESRFHSHGRNQAVQGHDALRAEFSEVFTRFPGFGVEQHRLLFGPDHWVLDWTLTFQPVDGERRGFRCLDLVEVSADGLVSQKDTYYDLAEAASAMGKA
jgi:SnoaL-like domain